MNSREQMNREARRKNKIKREIIQEVDDESMTKLARIGLIVIGVLVVFYILTMGLTGGFKSDEIPDNNDDDESAVPSIQYDEILAGETFKMKDAEYYVMFYDFSDKASGLYDTLITNYEKNHTDINIYKVDLSKGVNSLYIGENGNPTVTGIDNLKVKSPTLIKIKNGTNISYSEGKETIKTALK